MAYKPHVIQEIIYNETDKEVAIVAVATISIQQVKHISAPQCGFPNGGRNAHTGTPLEPLEKASIFRAEVSQVNQLPRVCKPSPTLSALNLDLH